MSLPLLKKVKDSMTTRTMNILMIGPHFRCRGGISAVGRMLYDFLCEAGVRITYLPSTDHAGGFLRLLYGIRSYFRFLVLLASGGYEIIHIHCSVNRSFYRKLFYLLLASLSRAKLIIHLHPERFSEFDRSSHSVIRRLIRYVFGKADAVVVLSESIKKKLAMLSPRDNVVVLGNPIESSKFLCPIAKDGLQVLFMGFIIHEKGVYDLLTIVPGVAREFPGVRFVFCGPIKTPRFLKDAADLQAAGNVEVKGWIEGEEKAQLFQNSRMLVLPSYSEGLPNVILEAMASCLPVVSTPVGAIPDIIADGTNGFLIKPGDREALKERIMELLGDPELCSMMGKENRKIVEGRYDISIIGRELLRIYQGIMEG